jgi:hypothetical protein
MFSSNPAKLLLLFFVLTLLFPSCGWRQKPDEVSTVSSATHNAQHFSEEIPFLTKEPENFQAEIVVKTFSGTDEAFERKIFVARRGGQRLTKFDPEERRETARLETEDGKIYLLDYVGKIYTEKAAGASLADDETDLMQNELASRLLKRGAGATFEKQGEKNGLMKYLVRLGEAQTGEILIFYDEQAKVIVKQEFYAPARETGGEKGALLYSMELKNLRLQTDDALFELPKDFVRVSAKEFENAIMRR